MKSEKKEKLPRVRLTKEKRELLIRTHVERFLASNGRLPTQRQVLQAIGGNIYSVIAILQEYRNNEN